MPAPVKRSARAGRLLIALPRGSGSGVSTVEVWAST
jgi:hypothetical protein